VIVQALTQDATAQQVAKALPDVQLARFGLGAAN
jgi:hypothetical protein